jgi:hypothetical protein
MSESKFPKRRPDGSFRVVARFNTTADVSGLMADYVRAWTRAMPVWVRIWRSASIQEERLEFATEFSAVPSVEADNQEISLIFEAKPTASRWKDWTSFLIEDILTVFPEVTFLGFES